MSQQNGNNIKQWEKCNQLVDQQTKKLTQLIDKQKGGKDEKKAPEAPKPVAPKPAPPKT